MSDSLPPRRTHGSGRFSSSDLRRLGEGTHIEDGVLIFHPENVSIGRSVYVGHQTILKGYFKNELIIEDGSWIGQQCFFHAAGGIRIGENVGIGPGVRILTSVHEEAGRELPILHAPLRFSPVVIQPDADIGVGAILLPGVTIGQGAQVGAGAVVTRDVEAYSVVAGNPAKPLRMRPEP